METIKSFTSLEQSKKLTEILPIESADMYYNSGDERDVFWGSGIYKEITGWFSKGTPRPADVPCWSLVALLFVLDFPSLTQNKEDEWEVCVFDHDNDDYIEKTADNPIDACYEMIIRLHELKML